MTTLTENKAAVTIARPTFAVAMGWCVAASLARRAALPILKCARLTVRDGAIRLEATDLDLWLSLDIAGEANGDGVVCLDAKRLADIAHAVNGPTVVITWEDTRAKLVSGRSRFELVGVPSSEFPEPPDVFTQGATATFDGPTLAATFKRGAPFCSAEPSRPTFNGAVLRVRDGRTVLMATDGIAMLEATVAPTALLEGEHIIPRMALPVLALVAATAPTVTIRTIPPNTVYGSGGHGWLAVETETVRAAVRLLEGPYPDYAPLIFGDRPIRATVDRAVLVGALERAALCTDDGLHARVTTHWSDGEVTARATHTSGATAFDAVPATLAGHRGDDPLELAFNGRKLLDVVKVMPSEQVELRIVSATRSVLIVDPADDVSIIGAIQPLYPR